MIKKLHKPIVGAILGSVVMSAQADFIDDSHADLTLLNRYLNQQGRGIDGNNNPSKAAKSYRDWGQGFQLNFKSGYTEGAVGVGLDVEGFYGLKLDSGGDLNDKSNQRDRKSVV